MVNAPLAINAVKPILIVHDWYRLGGPPGQRLGSVANSIVNMFSSKHGAKNAAGVATGAIKRPILLALVAMTSSAYALIVIIRSSLARPPCLAERSA